MLSAIIATHESERTLVPTLAALVPGVTAGLLTEAIVADAGSRDGTHDVADIAGCCFASSRAPLGERLRQAAEMARAPWLMFLRAGTAPTDGWIGAVERFIAASQDAERAAAFRPSVSEDLMRPAFSDLLAQLRAVFGGMPKPEQGLIVSRRFYQALGGHPAGADAEAGLLRRIGRARVAVLAVHAIFWGQRDT